MDLLKIFIALGLLLILAGCIAKQDDQPPLPPEGNDSIANANNGSADNVTSNAPPLPPDAANTQTPKTQENGPPLPPE